MKLILFISITILSFLTQLSSAQHSPEIWGLTQLGGNAFGTVFKLDEDGNSRKSVHEFGDVSVMVSNFGQYLEGSDQWLYRAGLSGGVHNGGGIYRYNYGSKKYEKLYDFGRGVGMDPNSSPVEKSGGILVHGPGNTIIGTSSKGGVGGNGVIFEYNLTTKELHKRVEFDINVNGWLTINGLEYGPGGILYGAAWKNWKKVVVFSYDPVGKIYNELHTTADSSVGWGMFGKLLYASNGKLYGNTYSGGLHDFGVIFEFDPVDTTWTVLHHFDEANGKWPKGHLIEAGNGRLFGMTNVGGNNNNGVLFEYNLQLDTFICHIKFSGANTGSNPVDNNLFQASNGKIYGLTYQGGNSNDGTLFEFDTASNSLSILYSFYFNGSIGIDAEGSVMQAGDGKLYGVCRTGTSGKFGSIFSYDIGTSTISPEKLNMDVSEGEQPIGRLLHHSNGKLYSTAHGGQGNGLIYSVDPVTEKYSVEYVLDKNGNDGTYGTGYLLESANGLMYGLTNFGGEHNGGGVFSFDPATRNFTVLYSFDRLVTGSRPRGGFCSSATGKLYALTTEGGEHLGGTIISLDPSTNEVSIVHHFDREAYGGGYPMGELVSDVNGILYGVNTFGGLNDAGGIFKLNPYNEAVEIIYEFDGDYNGSAPLAGLSRGPGNLLYGVASGGGKYDDGFLYSLNPSDNKIEILYHLITGDDGIHLTGRLLWASNNKLYGATRDGGQFSGGTIFEFDVTQKVFTTKYHCDITGYQPVTALTEIYGLGLSRQELQSTEENLLIYPNPVSNYLYVNSEEINGIVRFEILDMSSKLVKEGNIVYKKAKGIDVSDLDNGVYLLKIFSDNALRRSRFVKY